MPLCLIISPGIAISFLSVLPLERLLGLELGALDLLCNFAVNPRFVVVGWWAVIIITGSLFGLDQGFHSHTPISRVCVPPPLESD